MKDELYRDGLNQVGKVMYDDAYNNAENEKNLLPPLGEFLVKIKVALCDGGFHEIYPVICAGIKDAYEPEIVLPLSALPYAPGKSNEQTKQRK